MRNYIQKRITGQRGGIGTAVSTHDLHVAVNGSINRLRADAENSYPEDHTERHPHWRRNSLIGLCELVGAAIGFQPDTVLRRIYDVQHITTKTVSLTFADELTLQLGMTIRGEDVPIIPRSNGVAREMVEAYLDIHEVDEPELDAKRLARSLFNFACGYVAELDEVEDFIREEAELEDAARFPVETRELVAA
jgi:hypothetical protein